LLGQGRHEELFAACPAIDEFYRFDADPLSLRKSGAVKNLQKWLDAQNFDLALILLGDNIAPLLARARIPVRVGVRGTPLEACLTHRYDIGGPRDWTARERLNALRCLGYEIADSLPRRRAREKLFSLGLAAGEKYAALHPFGSEPHKWWSVERVQPLAARLRARYNLKTVLIGGREKISLSGHERADDIINTTGELSVGELLAVIENSLLVVTTDSGPFHIAAALNKPIVGLFRAARPGYAQIYPRVAAVFGENDDCRENCRWDFCQSDPCRQMQDISVEKVLEMMNDECRMMN
jgi:ADP-heptose:LPS heptosyltransferase